MINLSYINTTFEDADTLVEIRIAAMRESLERIGRFDPQRASTGALLLLEGNFVNGKMVLEGQTINAKGSQIKQRITWGPNPNGSVRQLWEAADTSGVWKVVFEGIYTRE